MTKNTNTNTITENAEERNLGLDPQQNDTNQIAGNRQPQINTPQVGDDQPADNLETLREQGLESAQSLGEARPSSADNQNVPLNINMDNLFKKIELQPFSMYWEESEQESKIDSMNKDNVYAPMTVGVTISHEVSEMLNYVITKKYLDMQHYQQISSLRELLLTKYDIINNPNPQHGCSSQDDGLCLVGQSQSDMDDTSEL